MTRTQLEYFIMTDKYHLLRDDETYLGYQGKRLWYRIKHLFKGEK